MTLTNDIIATEWESAIERYESATKAIELEALKLSEAAALKVLLARDGVEKLLGDNLYNQLNAAWDAGLPESNAVYEVSVDKDGNIQSYKPVDSLAEEFAINTGLEELVDDNADAEAAKFEVVFTPEGELDVKPVE